MPVLASVSMIVASICALMLPATVVVGYAISQLDTLPIKSDTFLTTLEWLGAIASALGILALASLTLAVGRREFTQGWVVVLGYLGFLAGIPAALELPWLDLNTHYMTNFPEVLRAAALLPIVALAISMSSIIKTLGKRSFRFQGAGGALQGAQPIVWATVCQVAGLAVALTYRDSVGTNETIEVIGQIVWVVAGVLVLVGFIYLVVNAFWAAVPLLHSRNRLVQLIDLTEQDPPPS
jgi:hypothetical protein